MAHPPASRDAAFTRLYDAHYDTVRAYAYRRDPAHVDDIVAETFLVAWRRLDELPSDVLPWLLGVARNARLNIRRGESRRLGLHSRVAAAEPRGGDTDRVAAAVEARVLVHAALAELSERDREVLTLAAWEDCDHAQIARVVGSSRAAVAVRLHRARRRLARLLASYETPAGDRPTVTGGLTDAS